MYFPERGSHFTCKNSSENEQTLEKRRWYANHLMIRVEAVVGDLLHSDWFVHCRLVVIQRRVGGQGKMDSWVWHEVCLELFQIYVEGSFETEGGCYAENLQKSHSILSFQVSLVCLLNFCRTWKEKLPTWRQSDR